MGIMMTIQLGALRVQAERAQERIEELERKLAESRGETAIATLRAEASEIIRQGGNLTRGQVASFLAVSAKKIQRMDAAGTLPRCPNMGSVVRYASRDVLRLASAR